MAPWWSNPSAEGLEEEKRNPAPAPTREPEPAPAETYPPPAAPPIPAPAAGAGPAESPFPPPSGSTYLEPAAEPARGAAIWELEPLRVPEPDPFGILTLPAGDEPPQPEPPPFYHPEAPPAATAARDEELDEEPFDEDEEEEDEEGEEPGAIEGREAEDKPAEAREGRRRRSRGRRGGRKRGGRADDGESPQKEEEEPKPAAEPVEHREPAPPARRTPPPTPAPAYLPQARTGRSGDSFTIPAGEADSFSREIIISVPERARTGVDERKIALFCDLENVALGVRDSEVSKFDINLVLERLLEKGKIIVKKAYADWERYSEFKRPFHEAAIELIDIPQKYYSGKNSADIKMVVDAMDLSYAKEHLDTFVLLSGDSDFSPLVSKLKENNKNVIGIGVKNSSSALLIDNCDEFIFYEDIWRDTQKGPKLDGLSKKTAEAFSLMVESIQALVRENKDVLWGSMIKQTMQRKRPSFNEGYYGYSTFSELLEDAEKKSIIKLKKDQRSGTYIVTGFAKAEGGTGRR